MNVWTCDAGGSKALTCIRRAPPCPYATAALFARRGARIVVLDVNESAAAATAAAICDAGGDAAVLRCDVSEPGDVARAFADIRSRFERLDILVNNAGISHVGTIEETT